MEVLDTAAVDGCTEQSLRGWLADPGTAHEPCEALLSPYTGPATATRVQGIGKREVMVKALPGNSLRDSVPKVYQPGSGCKL